MFGVGKGVLGSCGVRGVDSLLSENGESNGDRSVVRVVVDLIGESGESNSGGESGTERLNEESMV